MPETKMWRKCPISTCRRAKYFARTMMRMSFAGSDGWSAKRPKSKRCCAPFTLTPTTKMNTRSARMTAYKNATTGVRRKNEYEGRLARKKSATAMMIHISCLSKKASPPSVSGRIVARPKSAIASAAQKRNQSILEKKRWKNVCGINVFCRKFVRLANRQIRISKFEKETQKSKTKKKVTGIRFEFSHF